MTKHSLIFLLLLPEGSLFGQEVIGSAGQTYTTGEAIVSQTIGEAVIGTLSQGVSVSQGFHQSNPILTSSRNEDKLVNINVFPNPFTERVLISSDLKMEFITVYDLKGSVVFQENINRGESNVELELSSLNSGQYFIHVQGEEFPDNQLLKIIKQ